MHTSRAFCLRHKIKVALVPPLSNLRRKRTNWFLTYALPANLHRRSQTPGRHRARHPGLRAVKKEGRKLDGVLPFPQGENAIFLRKSRERDLLLFWLS